MRVRLASTGALLGILAGGVSTSTAQTPAYNRAEIGAAINIG